MASRRVKRIKRTKKQVHHGPRKTKHRRQRHTIRQRGGMLKAFTKLVAGQKLNPRGGLNYGGIEVLKVVRDDGEVRYYIGNKPLKQYAESSNQYDRDYGNLITKKLTGLFVTPDNGKMFHDQLYLDQTNFDKFKAKFPSAAPAAVAPGAAASAAPVASGASASGASASAASASAAEFDKICVIKSNQVSFLGTQFKWPNHEIPLEINKFDFAQKNKNLIDWLNENIEKFVFFKTEVTVRGMTSTTAREETYDAIFLSIHFKKTKENYCALAEFKEKDDFNNPGRIYNIDKTLYRHTLLFPNEQPGTTTTDQANVATCYIGRCSDLPTGITYNDFVKVIDQFVEYKKDCKVDIARKFYRDDPMVLPLFASSGSLSEQMSHVSLSRRP